MPIALVFFLAVSNFSDTIDITCLKQKIYIPALLCWFYCMEHCGFLSIALTSMVAVVFSMCETRFLRSNK